ncbi:MAG: hypothetical protein CMO81_00605 [Waddliaceae bacterium]|nr:hypothetical protein [Waddliaceae bacterium]
MVKVAARQGGVKHLVHHGVGKSGKMVGQRKVVHHTKPAKAKHVVHTPKPTVIHHTKPAVKHVVHTPKPTIVHHTRPKVKHVVHTPGTKVVHHTSAPVVTVVRRPSPLASLFALLFCCA